ncbi:MAG: hypothetical protein IPP64_11560 [Bacteroidetes bacterium]|nr:hypothetical protein [Bacteroidota bacterium]
MATLQLTPEIRDLIRLTVDSAIKATIEQLNHTSTFNPSIQDEDFLSAEQAAHFLKIKLSTFIF